MPLTAFKDECEITLRFELRSKALEGIGGEELPLLHDRKTCSLGSHEQSTVHHGALRSQVHAYVFFERAVKLSGTESQALSPSPTAMFRGTATIAESALILRNLGTG